MMSRWVVPIDDTNSMYIELRHVSETEGIDTPDWWADRSIMLAGPDRRPIPMRKPSAARRISRRRCRSGRSRCMGWSISARPIAASPCSANRSASGIQAVKAGADPVGLFRDGGAMIPTYCNNTVVRMPPAKTPEADKKLMREIGRRLARGYIEAPPLLAAAE